MWKPSGIPTTFGNEACFLDILMGEKPNPGMDFSIPKFIAPYIDLPDFKPYVLKDVSIKEQFSVFWKEKELGLLNRLDNDTAGFLYFVKTPEIFEKYRQLQSEGKVHKWYIAQILGTPKETSFEITMPIMHHRHKADRMIFIRSPKDELKGRSKMHHPSTIVKVLHTEEKTWISTLLVGIYKWVRHQIRVHLAGIWCSVIGDTLYGKDDWKWRLCLWSIGFQIQE